MKLWRREGLLLAPPSDHAWWHSHAQAPTILPIDDRLWRVYFAARDHQPRSRIMCADLDPGDGFRVLRIHPDPVMELGASGAFDSHGMGPATALTMDRRVHLYYTGMARRTDVPYQLAIGLAISDDGLRFRRAGEGPVLSTGPRDPFFMSMPCVRAGPGGFEMWYTSCTGWRPVDGQPDPFYGLRRTRSQDGLIWSLATEMVSPNQGDAEAGLTRAWILDTGDGRHLWYSVRGAVRFREPGATSYRLHHVVLDDEGRFAGPPNPVVFENPPLPGEWDDWMQAYACVQRLGDDLVMFYNGNQFGRGGFGYARLAGGALGAGTLSPALR